MTTQRRDKTNLTALHFCIQVAKTSPAGDEVGVSELPDAADGPREFYIIPLRRKLQNIIQGVSRLYGITAGGYFLGFCDQKCSYKHVSDFGHCWYSFLLEVESTPGS